MVTNRIISIVISLLTFIVFPIQLVTTFILGIITTLTFGLLLTPFSIIWIVFFLGPLLGLSYIYEKLVITRPIVSIIGIPLAIIANTYVALLPSMGEMESRFDKMILCQTFPYTYRYFRFSTNKLKLAPNDILYKIFQIVSQAKPLAMRIELLKLQNEE